MLSSAQSQSEAAITRKLFDLIVKKTNGHFDKLCEALHQTDQTHVVKNLLIAPGYYYYVIPTRYSNVVITL